MRVFSSRVAWYRQNKPKYSQKVEKYRNTGFLKNRFFDFFFFVRIDAPMSNLDVACSGPPRKYTKNPIFKDLLKIAFFMFFISFI